MDLSLSQLEIPIENEKRHTKDSRQSVIITTKTRQPQSQLRNSNNPSVALLMSPSGADNSPNKSSGIATGLNTSPEIIAAVRDFDALLNSHNETLGSLMGTPDESQSTVEDDDDLEMEQLRLQRDIDWLREELSILRRRPTPPTLPSQNNPNLAQSSFLSNSFLSVSSVEDNERSINVRASPIDLHVSNVKSSSLESRLHSQIVGPIAQFVMTVNSLHKLESDERPNSASPSNLSTTSSSEPNSDSSTILKLDDHIPNDSLSPQQTERKPVMMINPALEGCVSGQSLVKGELRPSSSFKSIGNTTNQHQTPHSLSAKSLGTGAWMPSLEQISAAPVMTFESQLEACTNYCGASSTPDRQSTASSRHSKLPIRNLFPILLTPTRQNTNAKSDEFPNDSPSTLQYEVKSTKRSPFRRDDLEMPIVDEIPVVTTSSTVDTTSTASQLRTETNTIESLSPPIDATQSFHSIDTPFALSSNSIDRDDAAPSPTGRISVTSLTSSTLSPEVLATASALGLLSDDDSSSDDGSYDERTHFHDDLSTPNLTIRAASRTNSRQKTVKASNHDRIFTATGFSFDHEAHSDLAVGMDMVESRKPALNFKSCEESNSTENSDLRRKHKCDGVFNTKWAAYVLVVVLLVTFLVLVSNAVILSRNRGDSIPTTITPTAPSFAPSSFSMPHFSSRPSLRPNKPSLPPVELPSSQNLFDFLVAISPDGGQALQLNTTAQYLAYAWLSNNIDIQRYTPQRLAQRYALATLFYSTNGSHWDVRTNWMTNVNECNWFSRALAATVCDAESHFLRLELSFNNLDGSIPPEISLLSDFLQILSLSGGPTRYLTGGIPSEMGMLSNLRKLNLWNNRLQRRLTSELGQLTKLRYLDLSFNQLTGEIVTELGFLSDLTSLDISDNSFTSRIPHQIGRISELKFLDMSVNNLSGDVPDSFGNLTKINTLKLESNQLRRVNSNIGMMGALEELSIANNILGGSIPDSIGQLTNLQILNLTGNQLSGSLPSTISELSRLAGCLDVSFNRLSGTIPLWLSNGVSKLRNLLLNGNQLYGMVPESFENFVGINVLRLDSNSLTGTMPSSVCQVLNKTYSTIFADCEELNCPCCTYCCTNGDCTCLFEGTVEDWRCF